MKKDILEESIKSKRLKMRSNLSYKIVPAILEKDQQELELKIKKALSFTNTVQIDIADQNFAKEVILPQPELFEKYAKEANLELHIMTENPIGFFRNFRKVGFKRFIGHIELMESKEEFLKEVTKSGGKAFLGVDLNTEVESLLDKKLLKYGLKGVTVMTVKAGASGQEFHEEALEKVKKLRDFFKDEIDIEVDGGVNDETIFLAKEKGANIFCETSYLFKSGDPKKVFEKLQQKIKTEFVESKEEVKNEEKPNNYRRITDVLPKQFKLSNKDLQKLPAVFLKALRRTGKVLKIYILINLICVFLILSILILQLSKAYSATKMERGEKLQEAIYWENVLKERPNYPDAYFKTAGLYYSLGSDRKAFDFVEKALYYDPNFKEAIELREKLTK